MARILIIEDVPDQRQALSELLSGAGHEVSDVPHGKAALQLLRNQPVEIVITDMIMPEMDGVETIVKLRRDHPHVKIVAVSGDGIAGPASYLRVARSLGVHQVLAKPFTASEILNAITSALAAPRQ